jgi:hypothetical protein
LEGRIAIIKKSIYGLKSSSVQGHAHFAKMLYLMGFQPTRSDQDVWIRKRDDNRGYYYISTNVDDFLITAKKSMAIHKKNTRGILNQGSKTSRLCDLCYAVSSLSRFSASPREGHLSRALRIWGYL